MRHKKLGKLSDYGDFFIRIVAGLIFVFAGYSKLSGISNFEGMLAGIGFPAPGIFAIIVAIIELIGGAMLVLGLWTYIAAILLAVVMVFAILTVHVQDGWNGFKYPLLLFVVLVKYIGTHGFANTHNLLKKGK